MSKFEMTISFSFLFFFDLFYSYFVIFLSTAIDKIYLHELKCLRGSFPSADVPNNSDTTGFRPHSYNKIIGKEDFIISDIVRKYRGHGTAEAFIRAGPRSALHFNPIEVKAAIVTCGGLCPGLNNVIRELVHALHYLYQVDSIYGIRFVHLYIYLSSIG